jgi:hypothetical protein
MRRRPSEPKVGELKSDVTPELTGADAGAEDAEYGSAGDGASPFGADLTGYQSPAPDYEEEYRLEPDPGHPEDQAMDQVERGFSDPEDEDREYSARPRDELRPITPDLLPSDDPYARENE